MKTESSVARIVIVTVWLVCLSFIAFAGTNNTDPKNPEDVPDPVPNAINETEAQQGFVNVFPNPAKDQLTVEIKNLFAPVRMDVVIYDSQGKEVIRHNAEERRIPVSSLSAGIYLLSLQQEGKIKYTTRLLIN
jgi:hypothetical protein